ncbi:hypothetical protein GOODEAATRI_014982, partial [Goodea atripinnis]
HHGRDARTLISMRNLGLRGLDCMPPVDRCIASRVLSPDEEYLQCCHTSMAGWSVRLQAHIQALGVNVNWQKSSLTPTQQAGFIDIALDSVGILARPTAVGPDSVPAPVFSTGTGTPSSVMAEVVGDADGTLDFDTPWAASSSPHLQRWFNDGSGPRQMSGWDPVTAVPEGGPEAVDLGIPSARLLEGEVPTRQEELWGGLRDLLEA